MIRDVLLVDDEPLFRAALKHSLRTTYRFVEATSPDEGIEALDANAGLRVVLLDLGFTGDSQAASVIEHVKSRSDDYRFIIITAHEELLGAKKAGEYAVFRYLSKAQRAAADAIDFALDQAFKDLERQQLLTKTRFLLDIQERINENRSIGETLDAICQAVGKIVDAYTCHIRVYDFSKGDYHLEGFDGPKQLRDVFASSPKASGSLFSGRVVKNSVADVIDDLQDREEFRAFAEASRKVRDVSDEEELYWKSVRSAYIVPISTGVLGKRVDAVLNVSSSVPAFFNRERRMLVREFVTQAAFAITKEWLQRKPRDIHESYSQISLMLSAIGLHLKGASAVNDIYDIVTRGIAELISAEVVSVFLYDPQLKALRNVAEFSGTGYVSAEDRSTDVYSPGQSLTGSVFKRHKTIMRPDPRAARHVQPTDDPLYDREHMRNRRNVIPSGRLEHYLGVPLKVGGVTQGVLRALNKKSAYYPNSELPRSKRLLERGFSNDCRNILEITASHLAVAIRNEELLEKQDRRVEQLQTLAAVGRIINGSLDIKEVLKLTIQEMAKVMKAQVCMLFLKDEFQQDRITLKDCYGISPFSAFYKKGEGVTGQCFKTGKPKLLAIANRNDGKYDNEICGQLRSSDGKPAGIESLMVVPIIAKGATLGVMKVINKDGDHVPYTESDLELFRTFADYVAVAIDNAQIYKTANDSAVLSLMVSVAAHEIRNTAGCIPSNVDGIRAELGTPTPEIEEMLSTIRDSASQANDFSREIQGFSVMRPEDKYEMDVNDILRGTLRAMKDDLPRYKQSEASELKVELSRGPLVCGIFKRPFEQMVRNIVINAFQALGTRKGGVVRVASKAESAERVGFAVITVEDNGAGIKSEHLPRRIFEGGFTTKQRGSGVGLWLVEQHLALLGGMIEVDSEFGKGSTFTVKIPLAAREAGR